MQLPQWFTSEVVSTHDEPHDVCVEEHPDEHTNELPAVAHSADGAMQLVPHAPQCAGCDRSVSHPSEAVVIRSPLQSPWPGSHAWRHAVPSHVATAWGRIAHGEHALPQVSSALSSAQKAPHRCLPMAQSMLQTPA